MKARRQGARRGTTRRATVWLAIPFVAGACATAPEPAQPAPGSPPPPDGSAPALPPIPAVDGALRIDVVYPTEGQTIAADSTFVFGATGSGQATLRINGLPVDVAPNGAFLAYQAVPPGGVYRFDAAKGAEQATQQVSVVVPPDAAGPAPGSATILASSVHPRGALAVRADRSVEIGFRGSPGGRAWVVLPTGQRVPLIESSAVDLDDPARNFQTAPGAASRARWAVYEGMIPPQPMAAHDTTLALPAIGSGLPLDTAQTVLELVVGADTARHVLPLNLAVLDPAAPRVAVVNAPPDAAHDWEVRGRPWTSGPFHWFWPPGTRLAIVEQRGGMLRARLTETLSAWVPAGDVRLLPPGTPPPFSTIGGVRFVHHADAFDVHIPLSDQLPYRVDVDDDVLTIDVYGGRSTSNFFQYGKLDPLIERAEWSQPDDDVYRVTLDLTEPVWGYQPYIAANGNLVIRVRRPPAIDADQPLRGLRIAIDAGHPPGGATGPTRLTEADANLWIAKQLIPMLEARGAHVVEIRPDTSAVGLGDRPRMATDSSVHVLLSIHNNAFPDGVNPFENNGTSTYYFHPHSAELARHMQRELLKELGLRDIGIGRADLALARPTWMPAVLTETSFLMIPQQEAALRDDGVQQRIAEAHLRALESFLRGRATR